MRSQSTDFVLVHVLHPLRNSDFEDEYEYEKNQIKSLAYALRLFIFFAFPPGRRRKPLWAGGRIFSRGIVPPYRTTTGPTSEFRYLSSVLRPLSSDLCHLFSET